jgi:hypothetical protein
MRLGALVAVLTIGACAQEAPAPAVIENTGKPMRLGFQCTEDDLRIFGLACPASHPCPVYLELAAVEPVGNRIFVAGNLHTESVTLSSVLLVGSEGGKTWQEPHERIRGAGLDQIQFLDFEAGWVAGGYLHTVPRDPFLLVTTDGGNNWRLRLVTSEGRVGTIESYAFDSRTHGLLLLDRRMAGEAGSRYELYESQTGGESWMIREVSDRPILAAQKLARAPEAGWRVRADATSYRIEKRVGERWETVAAFLTRVGECRAPELAVPPEPAVPPMPPAPPEPRKPA